eukprot:m51a1_g11142 hypothetical protein (410) ;mRNA; r:203231-204782
MDDNLRLIIQTFLGVFAMVALGQVLRRLLLKRPEDMRQLILYSRFYVWVTIPCSIFLMPTEGYYLMACCAVYEAVVIGLSMALFAFVPNGPLRASCVVSTTALSTGLFLALIDMLSGSRAVATLLLFDVPNNVVVFALSPFIMRWAEAEAEVQGEAPNPVEVACNDPTGMVEEVVTPTPTDIEVVSIISTHDNKSAELVELERRATAGKAEEEKGETPRTITPAPKDDSAEDSESEKPRLPWTRRVGRAVWSPDGKRIVFNLPVWALVLGLVLGLSNVHLPEMLLSILRIPKNANAFVAYTMLGLMLDLNAKTVRELWPYVLTSVVIRNVAGIGTGIMLRALLGPYLTAYGRMVVLFAFSMPLASPVQVMGQEIGANVSMLALTSTISAVISFCVVAVMFAIDGVAPRA